VPGKIEAARMQRTFIDGRGYQRVGMPGVYELDRFLDA
jgi:hypothetical protein